MTDLDAQSPESVVQRQLDAFNDRDMDAWLATYAEDATQYAHPGTLLAAGHTQIRTRSEPRFADPGLRAWLLQRSVTGTVVVDHEVVTRHFEDGTGHAELWCIYVVEGGLIRSASFITGPRVPGPA